MSDEKTNDTQAPETPADKRKAFGQTYWMLNSIEMFERLAYFGVRAVVPLYIMQATEPGGLHMTAIHKGWVYMWWAILQSWLPMFTGGIADRYGYKRVLFFAISGNAIGYLMMALMHNYYGFFAGVLVLATGTAFFKPALQGSIAQNLNKENSSMGWGVFYWVVNIGAVLAPVLATVILGKPHSAEGWRNLFLASSIYTSMNLLLLLTFRDVPSGADKTQSIIRVFWITVENIWPYWLVGGRFDPRRWVPGLIMLVVGLADVTIAPSDWLGGYHWIVGLALMVAGVLLIVWLKDGTLKWQPRLLAFLLIMSCFWMMMYQLWDLHPNFIVDWIDSSMVAAYAPQAWQEYGDRGLVQVPQQILLNLNAALIVLTVVPISWLVRKMRTLSAMLIGMTVATVGILVAGLTGNGWILLLGIMFFSLGEMLTGPKKNQYLGLIAPPGKKGLYLGYVNIPIGIGVGFGSMIAGLVYDNYGEKATLALKHLCTHTQLVARAAQSADWSDSLEKIPPLLKIERDEAFEMCKAHLAADDQVAGDILRDAFRYDRGQVDNLALTYLARHPEYEEKAAAELDMSVEGDEDSVKVTVVARFVHLVPKAIGVNRVVAFELVRELVNRDLPPEQKKDDAEIIAMLWEQFGNDPDVLDNLALEYLAQATNLLRDAIAAAPFENPPEDIDGRIKEIEKRIGVDRTKSFGALSVAMGANEAEVNAALDDVNVTTDGQHDRAYVYLIGRPHVRFSAVANKDWSKDRALLRELIRTDEESLRIVRAGIDEEAWYGGLWRTVKGVFVSDEQKGETTPEGVDYHKLAGKGGLIRKALDAKGWSRSAGQAAQLLGLNPFEARALVAAEVKQSPLAATKLLWREYRPQYKVWTPFASIGVVAIIALAIFGQMAKRWADMNA